MRLLLRNEDEEKEIEVPAIAYGFMVNNYGDSSELMYMIAEEDIDSEYCDETLVFIPLPQGNWEIIREQLKH